ncbi:extracellular solute-binding protein [Cohnella abietis]|uniref:Iron deficiency-induced protein A n=1 Tax=Cohnella abietis TaxID=2507935 RepID=A0A3T1CZU8_9BACL|nr:extracellular solute-binding protein [Cohnella abietis]BBI31348.1 iron deficiency-induced protein A [Cohnella abietis]
MKRITIMVVMMLICAGCGISGSGKMGQENAQQSNDGSQLQTHASVRKGQAVTVYTARHYAADTALFAAFTKETGIEVNEIKGTAEELVELMKREGESSDADLFFTVDGGVLNYAKRSGVLKPLFSDKIDQQVPPKWREPEHYWIGVTTRARVIVYAKDRVRREELSTYESLTEDKWKGRVLVRSHSNLYNQSLLASFIALNGEERAEQWANGIVKNLARAPEGGDRDQAKAIAEGIGDVAIMNTYYVGQLSVSADSAEARIPDGLGVFFPNQETTGAHLNISGIGLARYSSNEGNALKLVEYMTSKEGQSLLAQGSFEFPVNEDAEVPELLKSWGTFKTQKLDFADFETYRQKAIGIFERVGWL